MLNLKALIDENAVDPAMDIVNKETAEIVLDAVERFLTPQQKSAIHLVYLQSIKYDEAAQQMDVKISTLKSHLQKAKRKLRRVLRDYYFADKL